MSRGPDLNFLKNFWKKFQIAVRGWDREREGGVTLSTTRSRNRHIPRTAFRDDFSLLQPPHPAVHAIATGSLTAPEAGQNLGGYMGGNREDKLLALVRTVLKKNSLAPKSR
jgi:hypothetical protein